MTYEEAKARKGAIEREVQVTGAALRSYPRNAIGLTPDDVKATIEWRMAKRANVIAFFKLRKFNETFVKTFAIEYREECNRHKA